MIERYREWYEHERDSNAKMLDMLESVPADRRNDPRFGRAVALAGHLAACRENWLAMIVSSGGPEVEWWPEDCPLESLRPRYAWLESRWTEYLAGLDDDTLVRDFVFEDGGARWRFNVEGQIFQLVGHAPYHRGQIALLVDELGGETVDTDYVEWAIPRNPRFGAA